MSEPGDTPRSRIYSEVQDIDYESVHDFWEERARAAGKVNPLSVTMLQDDRPEFVEARDRHEKATVLPKLRLGPEISVLDIGCGTGRWGTELIDSVGHYHGFDFSSGLIQVGMEQLGAKFSRDRFSLQTLSATEMTADKLTYPGPFNLFLITGVMLYLNDDDVRTTLAHIADLAAPSAQLFVREPVGIENRLTLDHHYSEELGRDYSAVYRSRDNLETLFASTVGPAGFEITIGEFLYPEALGNRAETAQHYWVLERAAS